MSDHLVKQVRPLRGGYGTDALCVGWPLSSWNCARRVSRQLLRNGIAIRCLGPQFRGTEVEQDYEVVGSGGRVVAGSIRCQ
jgi:hypothetical protein